MFKHPFENDPFAMTYEAYKRIYKKDCIVNWYTEEFVGEIGGYGKDVYGFADFSENEIPRVYINAKAPVENAVELLAHELAHVAVGADKDMGQNGKKRLKTFTKNMKGLDLNCLEIKDLKVGDEVYFEYWGGWRDYWRKSIVERITPSGLIRVNGNYFRQDGYSRGGSARIYPSDDEFAKDEYDKQQKQKFVNSMVEKNKQRWCYV